MPVSGIPAIVGHYKSNAGEHMKMIANQFREKICYSPLSLCQHHETKRSRDDLRRYTT